MRARVLLVAPFVALALLAPRARAADSVTEVCVAASERAQVLRDEGKLRQARVQLVQCAASSCPAVVNKDCAGWLTDVDARIPSVVFQVRDANGNDVADVRVTFDGEPLVSRIDGRSVQVDPGEHTLRFVRASGEESSERIIVREGERGRPISVTLPRQHRPAAQGKPTEPEREPPPEGRPVPLGTYIFGGVALVGLAGFTYLWFSAVGDANDLKTTCEPHCTESDLTGPRTKALVADISLGVGAASALVAAGFYFFRPAKPHGATIGVGPLNGGAALTARGTF